MAIMRAFKQWQSKLEESKAPIDIILDYKNLEYFISLK